MKILGIDTSCDDTSASLLEFSAEGDVNIVTNVVSSQTEIHHKYGGIVPELASRQHIGMIWPVVQEAMGKTELHDIDAVAVCAGPGLIGSLLVGCSFAKALCYASGTPLVGVNHLEGHALSAFLTEEKPEFPFLALVVSGGHTSIYKVSDFGQYEELGRTRDDAAGEAYDKVSKLLGLGYPGGPFVDKRAEAGNPERIDFPRPYLPDTMDFSFSGLKTAVRQALEKNGFLSVEDVSASFQAAVVDVLARKMEWAIQSTGIKYISLSGGVAANSAIRQRLTHMAGALGVRLSLPPVSLCTDNAAMIALAGYHRFRKSQTASLALNPRAHMHLGS